MNRSHHMRVLPVFLAVAWAAAASGGEKSVRIDAGALGHEVRALLDEHGSGIAAGIWVGGVERDPWYEWKSNEVYPTASAIKTAFLVSALGTHFTKTGSLDSDPITRVRSGWWETKQGPIVYVVMTSQPSPGPRSRAEEGNRLARTADRLTSAVLARARTAIGAP